MRVPWLASLLVLTGLPVCAWAEGADTQQQQQQSASATASQSTADTPHLACTPVKVHFALDSDKLYDSEKPLLDQYATCLKNNTEQRITIIGNADERGSADYNRDLAQRRANTVADYLKNKGAEQAQIEAVVSRGEDSPICRDSNLKCWQLNRRTAIRASCHL